MTPFTDEDLKRIRERGISGGDIDALLARLEAAEKVIGLLPRIIGWADALIAEIKRFQSTAGERLYEELEPLRKAIQAWRKAAGK